MNWIITFLSQPWHWLLSGFLIAVLSITLSLLGERFGISSSYNAICSIAGLGKKMSFFRQDITKEFWRFSFIFGALLGGYLAINYLQNPSPVEISSSTITHLQDWGIAYPSADRLGYFPTEIFNFSSKKAILLGLVGGVLIGFGARYGEGCTSGHAIYGIGHLQFPSLVAVIGFFIGGLLMTHLIMPWLF